MKRATIAGGFAALFIASCTTTSVETSDATEPDVEPTKMAQSQAEPVDKKLDHDAWLNEVTCKVEPLTGSRVRKHEVCYTNAEWEQLADANHQKHRDLGRGGRTEEGM